MTEDNRQTKYTPDYAVPPGETLREVMEEQGISASQLAQEINVSYTVLQLLLEGKASITPEMAAQFEHRLGVPAHIWDNLERNYRERLACIESRVAHR